MSTPKDALSTVQSTKVEGSKAQGEGELNLKQLQQQVDELEEGFDVEPNEWVAAKIAVSTKAEGCDVLDLRDVQEQLDDLLVEDEGFITVLPVDGGSQDFDGGLLDSLLQENFSVGQDDILDELDGFALSLADVNVKIERSSPSNKPTPAVAEKVENPGPAPKLKEGIKAEDQAQPSPQRSAPDNDSKNHTFTNIEQLHFLWLMSSTLALNERNDRDWSTLERRYRELHSWGRQLCFKQKAKLVLQERRVRKQQKTFTKIKNSLGDRARITTVLFDVFTDRSKFEDNFIYSLAIEMSMLGRGYNKSVPGSILDWPKKARCIIIDKLLDLHLNVYKNNKLHLLYREFGDLFSIAEIELAVLSSCTCSSCVRDWELYGVTIGVDTVDSAILRLHWSKLKARRMVQVLDAHIQHESRMYSVLERNPTWKGWTKDDIDTMLKSAHTSKHCPLC
uniref:Uncharacterized protein n=1 Tax=Mucochytrium quahogii TaxID=96639 RepID=A0A7S2SPI0_9STRA|mmetsp:Transcript_12909/g.20891  ORF Transcript_12909/g.20891 Transcript_12909/m.20891 type:complete len:449 (+) Transcript_12909:442-1788(+)